jgi:nucleoside-diphosphate-sugar epimerase
MAARYLVTGCAGFIAAGVCRELLDRGQDVVGIDNINDAYDPRLKQWRLKQLESRGGFQFAPLDITDRAALADLFARYGNAPFAGVVNLAARAGVRASVANPWVYQSTNVEGTLNLLDLCRKNGVPKFVLASTSSLYGGHNEVPFREDADVTRPLSPYAASKLAAEALAYTYHHLHKLHVTSLRFFTVYGPAGRPDMSVFRFVRCIMEGEPIVVFGDGSQERDFTFVEDIARGVCAALELQGYQTINLGSDRPSKLSTMIDIISRQVDKKPVIEYRPAHPADVPATWADITRAREVLKWSPKVTFEDGLQASVDWYREQRDWAKGISLGEI